MRALFIVAFFALLLQSCGGQDPMAEVNALIAEGKVPQAKIAYQKLVEKEQDPNLERKYIQFCFEHEQYRDFDRSAIDYLSRYPQDTEVKNLQFEYYAILAKNAERQKDYALALEYVVQKLLNDEYADFEKWEGRQTTLLNKWYEHEKKSNDEEGMKEALITMRNLGFDNLAMDLDEVRFKALVESSK